MQITALPASPGNAPALRTELMAPRQATTGPAAPAPARPSSCTWPKPDAHDGARTQGYFHWALAVDDLEASLDSLLNAGATLVSAPADARRQ